MHGGNVPLDSTHTVPYRYLPRTLSRKDATQQKRNLQKSRRLYKQGKYFARPTVKSFHSKPSPHITKAREIYDVENVVPSKELANKTKCSVDALEKIVNKGRGAYYSSGSRPNQTAESWGLARLASAITGGNSSVVDYDILYHGCKRDSRALKLATRTCKTQKRCRKYTMKSRKTT